MLSSWCLVKIGGELSVKAFVEHRGVHERVWEKHGFQ